MTRVANKEIEERIKTVLVRVLGGNKEEIAPDKVLVDNLGMDSFAALELIFELEDELNIKIRTEDMNGFVTVGDIYKYIHNSLQESKGS